MNILISNDDGYLSQGIAILARIAGEFANVRVVAPERDRSGVSNSLTLDRPLRIRSAENGFYYVSGTPTDCIHLGLHALADFQPDLVLSGINHGSNLGDDTLYSGTVAAATEAYLLGIPAIAFSLNDKSGRYWRTAEQAVWRLLIHLFAAPKPAAPVLWNVNIPAVPENQIQGIAWGGGITSKAWWPPAARAARTYIGSARPAKCSVAKKTPISRKTKPA